MMAGATFAHHHNATLRSPQKHKPVRWGVGHIPHASARSTKCHAHNTLPSPREHDATKTANAQQTRSHPAGNIDIDAAATMSVSDARLLLTTKLKNLRAARIKAMEATMSDIDGTNTQINNNVVNFGTQATLPEKQNKE